ncbi:sorbitol operon activator [Agrilactobacillus composti DSM 18527 = JCM 14202]|uniref:Sorbitol operon activator n=1 Tax=Agrilactobacillus composti DSM 18527 = JCM 14202 TaxID=1423734 RepID=X0PGV3_9LACO|nr:transcriptional regulator GutM [Agrilactobacillus composti]KRM34660.1 sorbitol operon activator [Agrilactobacillus composti DSM 18527 = JCM 14202]GAF41168.1 glucitol operon activator protein [Agrilactobacillus composti DSM 18527 = JCM 14202]
MLVLGLALVGAFLIQSALGFFQIKNFSKNYSELRHQGRVLIGKNPKRFQSGTLFLISITADGLIQEARIMKGITIFAKFKTIPSLAGQYLLVVAADYTQLQRMDRLTRGCLLNAYKNYVEFRNGKLADSAYDTSVNVFSMPMFVKIKDLGEQFFSYWHQRTDQKRLEKWR